MNKRRIGAMELLGVFSFSLMLGWAFPIIAWFSDFGLPAGGVYNQSITLLALFSGIVCGYVLIRFVAFRLKLNASTLWALVVFLVVACTVPLCVFLCYAGFSIPYELYMALYFLAGIATAYFIVCLLDICGKTRISNFLVYTSASLCGATLLFFLCWLIPETIRPIMSIFYIIGSVGLLHFINVRALGEAEPVMYHKRADYVTSPMELEPLIFTFGIVFGISFVLLSKIGPTGVLVGVASMLIGSILLLAITAFTNVKLSIVLILRIIIVLLVAACLLIPFTEGTLYLVVVCVPVALWAIFTSVNYASLLKLVVSKKLHVFYHIAAGLIPKSVGFLIGWAITTFLIMREPDSSFVLFLMLGMAFVLVLVSMVFYPQSHHHDNEEAGEGDFSVVPITLTESANENLLKLKCEAVAKLYGLSSRESEILPYLARGRNAEYICNKLVISSHTVKSHIYNIYRKTNAHTQQKIMDLVDEYPIKMPDASH